MNNTLSISQLADGRFKTEILLHDGSLTVEIHHVGLHDSHVLRKIQEKNHYQRLPGIWYLIFTDTQNVIQRPSFNSAIDVAQEYIFTRDNLDDYEGFY